MLCDAIGMPTVTSVTLIMAASLTPGAPPDTAQMMQPSGNWTVDWSDTGCTAIRSYTTAAGPVLLAFRPSLDGLTVRLMVSRPGAPIAARHVPVDLSGITASALRFTPPVKKTEFIWINLARGQFDKLVPAGAVRINGLGIDIALAAPGMAAAAKALDTCNADLRTHWNANEADKARIAVPARRLVAIKQIVHADDYPAQARERNESGSTRVSLLIDEAGALKDCAVEEHSGVASIDAQSCALLMKRARYAPARDAAGKPIKSRITFRFTWKRD